MSFHDTDLRTAGASPPDADLFRLALEASPIGMMLLDRDGQVLVVNATTERLFGYTRAELGSLRIEALVPERFRAGHAALREAFFAAPSTRPMGRGRDLRGLRADATEFPIEIGLTPLGAAGADYVLVSIVDLTERRRADEQFRLAIEASPTGMMMVDEDGAIVLVNAQIEALFGYARAALIGREVGLLVPERFREKHPLYRADFLRSPQARPMGAGRELFGLRADGSEVPIEIGLNPLRTRDGLFVLASVVDISARKRADAEREALLVELQDANAELERRGIGLRDALAERETMLQEIHHRVKNNLQIVSSLLRMQVRQRASGEARAALEDCEARVQAMALLHEQLYDSADYSRVSLARYVTNIVQNVLRAADDRAHGLRLETALDGVTLSVDRAIPCGLVVSELVTNTLRHAKASTLSITLSHVDPSLVRLVVRDDGVGLPTGYALGRSPSLGHHLVVALTRQLGGQLEMGSASGTTITITFPREATRAA